MVRIQRILNNPNKKKDFCKIFGCNVLTLIFLILFILNLSLIYTNVNENNTYEITGVVTNIEKPYHKPNSTPMIVVTIGNIDYNLLVNDSYNVSDLLYEVNVGTEVVAKVTEYKTLVITNKLYGKKIIVDLRNGENVYYDIVVENKHRKINLISISILFGSFWIVACVLSFLYIRFVL